MIYNHNENVLQQRRANVPNSLYIMTELQIGVVLKLWRQFSRIQPIIIMPRLRLQMIWIPQMPKDYATVKSDIRIIDKML